MLFLDLSDVVARAGSMSLTTERQGKIIPWGFAAAAVGTVASGALQADAAGNAADAQSQANAASIAEQRRQYDQNRLDQAPYRQIGNTALQRLTTMLGNGSDYDRYMADIRQKFPTISENWTPYAGAVEKFAAENPASEDPYYRSLIKPFGQEDLAKDPVYQSGLQFGLDQGTNALNQRALQSGSYDSGSTLKALTQYANDYGSTKANDAYNRYNTTNDSIYNKLAGLAGLGQTATNQVSASGSNMANNVSSALTDTGNSRAAGIIGGANAWGSTASGLNNLYNNYNQNSTLQSLLNGNNNSYGMYGNRGTFTTSDFSNPSGY